jgi:dCMP deaminase
MNAILNALYNGSSVVGASIFIHNLPVCQECAKAIVQSGISYVFINREIEGKWLDAWQFSKTMFKEAGLKVFKFNKQTEELVLIDD